MTDFSELDDETAQRILSTMARAGQHSAAELLAQSSELRMALAEHFGVSPAATAAPPGDLARQALAVLAAHPQTRRAVEIMADEPPERSTSYYIDPFGISLAAAALYALQTQVEISRDKAGHWTFKLKTKPVGGSAVKALVEKLISYLP
jgi:hypothetical protein